MAEKSLLGIGSPLLDILSEVEEPFLSRVPGRKGGREVISSAELEELLAQLPCRRFCPGGAAGNTVAALACLGGKTAFFGRTGADEAGRYYRERLGQCGCDVSRMTEDPDRATGRCLSLITPDGERTMRSDLGASAYVTPEEAERMDLSGISVVFIEGYQIAAKDFFERVLSRSRQSGCGIAVDLASFELVAQFRKEWLALWKSGVFDLLFANRQEAETLLGAMPPDALAKCLGEHTLAVVKCGNAGAYIAQGKEMFFIPAEKVPVRDTTGAGDLFAAGFFSGYLQQFPLPVCGRMGAAVAAECVRHIGAAIPAEHYPGLRVRLNGFLQQTTL